MNPAIADELSLEFRAVPRSVTEARHAAAELAARVGADRNDVELAIAEAVGNAVRHAYPPGDEGSVALTVRVEGDDLVATVSDHGVGLGAVRHSARGLGLGLPLIARLARRVEFDSPTGGGTIVRMGFSRAQPGVGSA